MGEAKATAPQTHVRMSPQSPDNVANDNGEDDESDDDYLYEWHLLELREFRMLRSYVQVSGNEYYLFYIFLYRPVCVCVL